MPVGATAQSGGQATPPSGVAASAGPNKTVAIVAMTIAHSNIGHVGVRSVRASIGPSRLGLGGLAVSTVAVTVGAAAAAAGTGDVVAGPVRAAASRRDAGVSCTV